eukprot:scaffold45226_cov23-Cyclotella_meneghiniana.AAC.1
MLSRDRPTEDDEAGVVDWHWMQREKDWDQGLVLQHSQLGLVLMLIVLLYVTTWGFGQDRDTFNIIFSIKKMAARV